MASSQQQSAAEKAAAKAAAKAAKNSAAAPNVENATLPGATENASATPPAAVRPSAPKSDDAEAPKGLLIEIKQSIQGPSYGYNPQEIVDWPDVEEAKRLIKAEIAVLAPEFHGRPVRTHKSSVGKPAKK